MNHVVCVAMLIIENMSPNLRPKREKINKFFAEIIPVDAEN